jgi:ribosomal protein L11 methyltransferase
MFELSLYTPQAWVDVVSDALEALDALSISVEDADANAPIEAPLFGEPGMAPSTNAWNRSRVLALFAEPALAKQALTILLAQEFGEHCSDAEIREVPDLDWVRLTQSQFEPVLVAPNFWIVPSWHEPPDGATQVIRLDPGLAFGTGTHPTTRMCLGWIARHGAAAVASVCKPRVLDYGCGSGILAIAAAQVLASVSGAAVDALDLDPAAVTSTIENAKNNGVVVRAGLPDLAQGHYDVVLANILATPLKVLAPLLCAHVARPGHLVLAGILAHQADELKAAYAPYGELSVADTQDGWILMTAAWPAHPASTGPTLALPAQAL